MLQFYGSILYVRRTYDEMPPARDDVKREIELPDGSRIANDNMWLFNGGRLSQQFVCTAAARVELKRMSALQTPKMQQQLRADTYDQLKDALRDGYSPADIGRRVICPSSVKGSRRAMYVSPLTATESGGHDLTSNCSGEKPIWAFKLSASSRWPRSVGCKPSPTYL